MTSYQLPDERTVADSMAFTLDDIQYPSNWMLLSSKEERPFAESPINYSRAR